MPWWHLQCAKGTGGEKGELRKLLTQGQVDDVRERAKITRDAAEKAIRAAWTHLLYAVKDETALDGKPFELAQTTLLARDRSSIATSAYEKLFPKGDSIVKEQLGPKILMARPATVWPASQPHLAISELREWFAAYVYLPKLRDPSVLENSIADGVQGSDHQFAYADGIDEVTGKYVGLILGRLPPTSFGPGALVFWQVHVPPLIDPCRNMQPISHDQIE